MPAPWPPLLVHGEETFLVDRAVREWRARSGAAQLDVEVFDAPARLLELRRSVAEVPLLDPARAILVRDPPQLSGAARRGSDPPDALAEIVAVCPPTTALCLVAHGRLPAQNPVPAAVRAAGGTISYHPAPRGRELRAWLDGELSRRGLRFERRSVELLLQVAGSDLGALDSELDKLAAFADGTAPGADDVARLVAGDEPMELYGVIDQLLGPQPGRGASTLDHLLAEGRSSQHLIAILAGQVRDLMAAQAYIHVRGTTRGLAGALHIPEWRAERLARQARAVPAATAASWLRALHDADRRVKLGEVGDADALRLVGLRAAAQVSRT